MTSKKGYKVFPFKYFYTRVYPLRRDEDSDFTGVIENSIKKINVTDLESFINLELDIQEKIFKRMGCDDKIIQEAIDKMRLAYNSKK